MSDLKLSWGGSWRHQGEASDTMLRSQVYDLVAVVLTNGLGALSGHIAW